MITTGLYAALTAILIIALAYRVVQFRRSHKAGMGDNASKDFQVAIRAHANLVENAPMFLILMALAEYRGTSQLVVHAGGILFLLSRLAHARGFFGTRGGYSKGRFYGTGMTWLLILMFALINIYAFVQDAI